MCNFINKDNFKVSNFYRLPKNLMSEKYVSLRLESKVAYCFLLDKVSLSIENGWFNEEGEVFVKIKRSELMKGLGVKGSQKMVKIMDELKSYGLIFEERVGLGKCNKIFLYDLDSLKNQNSDDRNSNVDTFENQNSGDLKSKVKGFVFQKYNKTNINKTKYNKTDLTKTQSNQGFDKNFDFNILQNKNPHINNFDKQNSVDNLKKFVDERMNLNNKEPKRIGLIHKDIKNDEINNKKYDYDIKTLDTARELLGWSVDYKDANTLLKEACGNLYVLDLAYEKMMSIKGTIKNIVGYLRAVIGSA